MKFATLLVLACAPTLALAQQGTVQYDQTVKLDIQLPPEMAHMRDQIPSEQTFQKVLLFSETASLMKAAPQQPQEAEEVRSGPVRMRFGRGMADEVRYTDFDAATSLEQRDFMGRTFRIAGEAYPLAWRLMDERSEFLGYLCQKAVATRDSVDIEAWFTPEIPVPAGPAFHHRGRHVPAVEGDDA